MFMSIVPSLFLAFNYFVCIAYELQTHFSERGSGGEGKKKKLKYDQSISTVSQKEPKQTKQTMA